MRRMKRERERERERERIGRWLSEASCVGLAELKERKIVFLF